MKKISVVLAFLSFAALALPTRSAQAVTVYAPSSDCRPLTANDAANSGLSYYDFGGNLLQGTWGVLNNSVSVTFICPIRASGPLTSVTVNLSKNGTSAFAITGKWFNTVGQLLSTTAAGTSGVTGFQSMTFFPNNISGPNMPANAFSAAMLVNFATGSLMSQLLGYSYTY